MTGEAVPEDPQHSYSNILRAGFSEAYLREKLGSREQVTRRLRLIMTVFDNSKLSCAY